MIRPAHLFFLLLWCNAYLLGGDFRSHRGGTETVRPKEATSPQNSSWWDVWGLKRKLVESYQDTISWNVDLVFGKKATDSFGEAVLEFLFSKDGRKFIFENKRAFLVNQLEETNDFEEAFWKAFEHWIEEKGYKKALEDQWIPAINLLPLKPRIQINAYYPKTPVRKVVSRGVDHIQYLLANDIARNSTGGGLAPGIIANGIRRASRGQAILGAVQESYNRSRNQLTERIVNLIGVLAKKLVEEGVKNRNLDMDLSLSVKGWESRPEFKANPTFPIRSYFFAENEKNAIIPYQVTQFLDSLDQFDFKKAAEELRK